MGQFVEETSKAPSPFAYCSREGLAASKLACLVALDVGPRSSLGAVKREALDAPESHESDKLVISNTGFSRTTSLRSSVHLKFCKQHDE